MNNIGKVSSKSIIDPVLEKILNIPDSTTEEPCLIGMRCMDCGQFTIGNKILCANCSSEKLERRNLSRKGILYSFAISRVTAFGFKSPLILGLVDLPEGIRIWSQIEVGPGETIAIGMNVEMIIGKIRKDENNNDIIGFKFKLSNTKT